jgi:serine phosphatase RsbU (regulator of sigma subunit)/anti-anti-sigma regulatory factor
MRAKVLIVDDDRAQCDVLRELLAREGIAAETACNGMDGQRLLEASEFDVAIVDLWMPGIDGFALLEWIEQKTPWVVPLVLSGTQNLEDAVNAVRRGAFDFVSKPITDYSVFVQHVERALCHRRLMQSHQRLLDELQRKNRELEGRLEQLELAHSTLQIHARYVQDDLNRAMHIQQAMLPRRIPFADRVSASALYLPAGKVGGDLYDIFRIDDHRMVAYIADTTGHGVSSAMVTVFLNHVMRPSHNGNACNLNSPGAVLCNLNRVLHEEKLGPDMFVSLAYVVIDTHSYEVEYATAGHPPILVRKASGELEAVHVSAPALGINPNVAYTAARMQLSEGDALVLYTDGVPDARNADGSFFGQRRLRNVVTGTEASPETLTAAIAAALEEFCGRGDHFDDDVTVLVLGAQPQRTPFRLPERVQEAEPPAPTPEDVPVDVLVAHRAERLFISVLGAGTWKESQRVLELCRQACASHERSVVLDFSGCRHLDSTFLGALHTIAVEFDKRSECRFEVQNIPKDILREMSELGLTSVLMHFRPDALSLPKEMHRVDAPAPAGQDMSRLLLGAHEALVDADPRNADRFAAVLKLLHEQAERARNQ